ncbi:MAG: hypothetical protein JW818_14970 [Pirellulales bacterium]|nr:hypothetical protein [Pirellulales bacterium]
MSRKSFPLRISPDLYKQLEAWAQAELRSVNGQIEYILDDAVKRHRWKEAGLGFMVEEDKPTGKKKK